MAHWVGCAGLAPLWATGLLLITIRSGWAFTPESPAVLSMVKDAARHLESATDARVGGRCLLAMALLKAGRDSGHAMVQEAIKDCQDVATNAEAVSNRLDIYETSVAILFLCEIDPSLYSQEIQVLLSSLHQRQKPFGGWGYPTGVNEKTSDTSMTQYAVLASWVAHRSGIATVTNHSMQQVCLWLMRTQDPTGAWGYQGRDPGPGAFDRVEQQEVRHSLSAAGLGSLYICASFLGLTSESATVLMGDEQLPPALKLVTAEPERAPSAGSDIDPRLLRRAIADGDRWLTRNYRINPENWTLYYLYTLERYKSFQELATGRVAGEPTWYNDGVKFLKSIQKSDGSLWPQDGGSAAIDTAFGILFLKRSAQKSIERVAEEFAGRLTGGRGLPKDTSSVRVEDGKVVRTPFQGTVDRLLEILESADHPDLDAVSEQVQMDMATDPSARANQLARLRRLVEAESSDARRAAVRALSSVRDLDNIPSLIYALSDPDPNVMLEARRGLRFISRKFRGFGLPENPSEEERQRAIDAWKNWYLSIRPDAQFLN